MVKNISAVVHVYATVLLRIRRVDVIRFFISDPEETTDILQHQVDYLLLV